MLRTQPHRAKPAHAGARCTSKSTQPGSRVGQRRSEGTTTSRDRHPSPQGQRNRTGLMGNGPQRTHFPVSWVTMEPKLLPTMQCQVPWNRPHTSSLTSCGTNTKRCTPRTTQQHTRPSETSAHCQRGKRAGQGPGGAGGDGRQATGTASVYLGDVRKVFQTSFCEFLHAGGHAWGQRRGCGRVRVRKVREA